MVNVKSEVMGFAKQESVKMPQRVTRLIQSVNLILQSV